MPVGHSLIILLDLERAGILGVLHVFLNVVDGHLRFVLVVILTQLFVELFQECVIDLVLLFLRLEQLELVFVDLLGL